MEEELAEIFIAGDSRYNLFELEAVNSFFVNKALIIKKEEINFNPKFKEVDIRGPQKLQKAIALEILKNKGLIFEGFEKNLSYGRPDILAKDKDGKLIAVECGPCRLSKAIDYFRIEDLTELWLVHAYSNENHLYIIKKGTNFKTFLENYNKKIKEQIKKIKSPMDNFNKPEENNENLTPKH